MKLSLEFKILIWLNVGVALYLLYRLHDLIFLLMPASPGAEIELSEVVPIKWTTSPDGKTFTPDREIIIPQIIHQTYKTEQVPTRWLREQYSCKAHNDGYQYMFWTDETSRHFIKEHYSWFLPTFDSYPYNIMRADAIRYFILYHYGGVYIDLDNGCNQRLDPLLTLPAFFRKTDPTGVSNDVMGSIPKHDFFKKIIDNLQKFNRNWLLSYITIMYSTGPLFVSVLWKQYMRSNIQPGHGVRILRPESRQPLHTIFFYDVEGSSWHNADAQFMLLMNRHIGLSVFCGFMIAFLCFFIEYKLIQLFLKLALGPKSRSMRSSRRSLSPSSLVRNVYRFVQRQGGNDNDGNSSGSNYTSYSMANLDSSSSVNSSTGARSYQNSPKLLSTSNDDCCYYDSDSDGSLDNHNHHNNIFNEKQNYDRAPRQQRSHKNSQNRASSAFVSTVTSIPVIGSIFNWIDGGNDGSSSDNNSRRSGYKTNKKPISPLLPTYHVNGGMDPTLFLDSQLSKNPKEL